MSVYLVVYAPGVWDTDYMINIRRKKLKEFVSENRTDICKTKEGVVSEDGGEIHDTTT